MSLSTWRNTGLTVALTSALAASAFAQSSLPYGSTDPITRKLFLDTVFPVPTRSLKARADEAGTTFSVLIDFEFDSATLQPP